MKLIVRDTGTGMSPDIVDKIFDPFFTTKEAGGGNRARPLGRPRHCKAAPTATLPSRASRAEGSTFTVYFPKIAGELETDAVSDDELPTGSERILFVDDEEALVEMGEDILAELGYEVTSRMNGREALALLKDWTHPASILSLPTRLCPK